MSSHSFTHLLVNPRSLYDGTLNKGECRGFEFTGQAGFKYVIVFHSEEPSELSWSGPDLQGGTLKDRKGGFHVVKFLARENGIHRFKVTGRQGGTFKVYVAGMNMMIPDILRGQCVFPLPNWVEPIPNFGEPLDPWGNERPPHNPFYRFVEGSEKNLHYHHLATDYPTPPGTPVEAMLGGVVTLGDSGDGWGHHVIIRSEIPRLNKPPYVVHFLYEHMAKLGRPKSREVGKGEPIGFTHHITDKDGNELVGETQHLHLFGMEGEIVKESTDDLISSASGAAIFSKLATGAQRVLNTANPDLFMGGLRRRKSR